MELGDYGIRGSPKRTTTDSWGHQISGPCHCKTPSPHPITTGPHNLGTPNSRSHKISAPPNPGATVPEPWGHNTTGTQHPGGEGGRTSGSPRSQPRSGSPCTPPQPPFTSAGGDDGQNEATKGNGPGGALGQRGWGWELRGGHPTAPQTPPAWETGEQGAGASPGVPGAMLRAGAAAAGPVGAAVTGPSAPTPQTLGALGALGAAAWPPGGEGWARAGRAGPRRRDGASRGVGCAGGWSTPTWRVCWRVRCPGGRSMKRDGAPRALGCPGAWSVLGDGAPPRMGFPGGWSMGRDGATRCMGCPGGWGILGDTPRDRATLGPEHPRVGASRGPEQPMARGAPPP